MSDEKLNKIMPKALNRHQAYERVPKKAKIYFECIAHNAEVLYEALARAGIYQEQNDLKLEYVKYIFEAAKFTNIGFYLEEDIEAVKQIPLKHVELGAELFYRDIHGRDDLKKLTNDEKIIRRLGRDMALYHHERWDGRGYPDGLYKEEIPITARIVIICCEFLRLTTTKIMGKAMSREDAIEKISSESSKAYDPIIVDAFVDVAKDFVLYGEEFKTYEERLEVERLKLKDEENIEQEKVLETTENLEEVISPPPIVEAKPHKKRLTPKMSRYIKRERPIHIDYCEIQNTDTNKVNLYRAELIVNAKYYGGMKPEIYSGVAKRNNLLLSLLEIELDEIYELISYRKHLELPIKPIIIRLYDSLLEKKTVFNNLINFLTKNEIDPGTIIFEISENILLLKNKKIKETIKKLRQAGIRFAIYDFTLDYGALQRLCKFKFDYLEVDRNYTKNLEINPKVIGLVSSILDVANAMGVEAICDGVDSEYLRDLIVSAGYKLIEGYSTGDKLTIKEMIRE